MVLFVLSIANELATRRAHETANRSQVEADLVAEATIRNAEIVQAMHMLPAMAERWAGVNGTVVDATRRSGDVGGVILATTKFVRFFVQMAILGVGAWLVINSQLTAGVMIAASILLGRALAPVELAICVWRSFAGARLSYARLKQAIAENPAPPPRTRLPAPQGKVVRRGRQLSHAQHRPARAERRLVQHRAGRGAGDHRSLRRRQEHAVPADGRAGASQCRRDPARRLADPPLGQRADRPASSASCRRTSSCLPARCATTSPACSKPTTRRS